MDKSPDAFRTISEVAIDLDLPQHVLRFWETRFVQIRPLKRGGGRRYYRPDDVDLLKGIRHLLYGEGYTIRGVQRILKEQGVRFVMNVWRDGAPQPPPSGFGAAAPHADDAEPTFDDEAGDEIADDDGDLPPDDAYSPYAPHHLAPVVHHRAPDEADFAVPMPLPDGEPAPFHDAVAHEPGAHGATPAAGEAEGAAAMAQRFAPRLPAADRGREAEPPRAAVMPRATPRPAAEPRPAVQSDGDVTVVRPPVDPLSERPAGLRPPAADAEKRPGLGQLLDRLRSPGGRDAEPGAGTVRTPQSLSRDEIRRLQSTLFELLECKRLLDQVR